MIFKVINYKIRSIINMFIQKSYSLRKDENLSIDEMMVPFKGRTSLRKYMPKNLQNRVYKYFVCVVRMELFMILKYIREE